MNSTEALRLCFPAHRQLMNGRRADQDHFHQPAQQRHHVHHRVGQDREGRHVEPLQLFHQHGIEGFVVPPGRPRHVVGRRSSGGGRGRGRGRGGGGGGEGRRALQTAAVIQQFVVALLDELLWACEHALQHGQRRQDRALHAVFLEQETAVSLIVLGNYFELIFIFYFFSHHTHKVLIGIVSITVWRIDSSIFHGLLDDVPHVMDILDGHRHKLLQQMSVRMSVRRTAACRFRCRAPTWVCCRYQWTFLTSCLTAFSRLLNSFSSLSNISSLTCGSGASSLDLVLISWTKLLFLLVRCFSFLPVVRLPWESWDTRQIDRLSYGLNGYWTCAVCPSACFHPPLSYTSSLEKDF